MPRRIWFFHLGLTVAATTVSAVLFSVILQLPMNLLVAGCLGVAGGTLLLSMLLFPRPPRRHKWTPKELRAQYDRLREEVDTQGEDTRRKAAEIESFVQYWSGSTTTPESLDVLVSSLEWLLAQGKEQAVKEQAALPAPDGLPPSAGASAGG